MGAKGKSKTIIILLLTIIVLYFIFLHMDLFKIQTFHIDISTLETFIVSNIIKFLSMLLVFFLSLIIGKDSFSSKDASLLKAGLSITIIADIFLLLLNKYYTFAVGLFCIVQILYSIRYNNGNAKAIIRNFSLVFIALLLIYIITDLFIIKFNFIIIMAIYYSICLLSNIKKAISLYKGKTCSHPNSIIILLGMILFILCDINVASYYIIESINLSNNFTMILANTFYISIWFFYLPSQLLLSLSGYKSAYLKDLFPK